MMRKALQNDKYKLRVIYGQSLRAFPTKMRWTQKVLDDSENTQVFSAID